MGENFEIEKVASDHFLVEVIVELCVLALAFRGFGWLVLVE